MGLETTAPHSWSENALAVLRARYLIRDPRTGEPAERPEDLLGRVARSVAEAERRWAPDGKAVVERWASVFLDLMARRVFLPNSPTLMNAGRDMGMLSACFVLPIEDSIESMFETLKHAVLIQKAGGGTGFDFSRLRPEGDIVASSGGKASGPVSFLEVFSSATRAIQQGAFRRGANMGVLRVTHPDILKFLHAKDDLGNLTNFNISVSLTDEFMRRLEDDRGAEHWIENPRTGERSRLARSDRPGAWWTVGEVFDLLVERAWASGEPGVVFMDRINRDNMTPAMGRIEATNPCSEQPLIANEACTLGSINLVPFVGSGEFDFPAFRQVAGYTVRFLDDVVEVSRYPTAATDAISRGNRRIGLGLMGFADALYLLEMPYDSAEARRFGETVMQTLNEEAHAASEALARERGVFPNWPGSRWNTERHRPQRNVSVTTIAPTGTISILAGCSSGIEPLFSLVFTRNILDGRKLLEVNPIFARVARSRGFYSDSLLRRILEAGTLRDIPEIPEDVRRVFQTARDIAPDDHVQMQAAFQRHCDSGISKTVNFPAGATREQVRELYLRAYHAGLKGVTIYRDGSRPQQPMTLGAGETGSPLPPPSCHDCEL